jgi:hypothetical protein
LGFWMTSKGPIAVVCQAKVSIDGGGNGAVLQTASNGTIVHNAFHFDTTFDFLMS